MKIKITDHIRDFFHLIIETLSIIHNLIILITVMGSILLSVVLLTWNIFAYIVNLFPRTDLPLKLHDIKLTGRMFTLVKK